MALLTIGLMLSIAFTLLCCGLLYFFIKRETNTLDHKLKLLFDLIHNEANRNTLQNNVNHYVPQYQNIVSSPLNETQYQNENNSTLENEINEQNGKNIHDEETKNINLIHVSDNELSDSDSETDSGDETDSIDSESMYDETDTNVNETKKFEEIETQKNRDDYLLNYNKIPVKKLREIASEKKLSNNVNKIKKKELIQLLIDNNIHILDEIQDTTQQNEEKQNEEVEENTMDVIDDTNVEDVSQIEENENDNEVEHKDLDIHDSIEYLQLDTE